jgi:hypothetical protein
VCGWLINLSELPALLGVKPVRSELTYLLVSLDKEYTATQPGEPWEAYCAQRILGHFRPSELCEQLVLGQSAGHGLGSTSGAPGSLVGDVRDPRIRGRGFLMTVNSAPAGGSPEAGPGAATAASPARGAGRDSRFQHPVGRWAELCLVSAG